MLYKDQCNAKSNQQNLGTIKCSNLCTEIVQYSAPDEVAVCNLASIALNRFVKIDGGEHTFNFQALRQITWIVTRNLNRIIDINYYPLDEARRSNFRHRPIGIGVQVRLFGRVPSSLSNSTQNSTIWQTTPRLTLCDSKCLSKSSLFRVWPTRSF